ASRCGESDRERADWDPGAAEQGDRRRERVRACLGDTSGRSPQGSTYLRDHESAVGWLGGATDRRVEAVRSSWARRPSRQLRRSEEHTSELQSRENLVCRLLLEKKKKKEK